MLLIESKLTEVLTEGLKYHLDTKTPLYENVYRPGSQEYFSTIKQARHLLNKGILTELCLEDMELLFETEVGEFGIYEGEKVPLDFPMINEITLVIPSPAASWRSASEEPMVMQMGEDRWMNVAGKSKAAGGLGYKTKYSDIQTFLGQFGAPTVTFSHTDRIQMPTVLKYMEGDQVNYKVIAGEDILASLIEEDPDPDVWVVDITEENEDTISEYRGYNDEVRDYLATWAVVFDKMLKKVKDGTVDEFIESLSGTARKAAEVFKKFIEDNKEALTEAKLDSDVKKELIKKLIRAATGPSAVKNIDKIISDLEKKLIGTGAAATVKYVHGKRVEPGDPLYEAKYKGKEVKLNKPMRSSGPKKYKVYTRNDKGNVVVVNFGDTKGGLRAKINDREARKAFSDRHNCPAKKDKTKAGYWSCRLPRYASLLGLKSSFGGYW